MAFGIKYRVEFKDRQSILWRTDILEDGFVGSITELKAWGNNPLKIKFRASNIKLKHAPVCPKNVELVLVSETDYALMEFAYSSSKHYLMKVYEDTTNIRFEGYVLKGLGGESYTNPPYPVKLQATDGLAQLKDVPYVHIGGNDVVKGSLVLAQITNNLLSISKDFLDNSSLFPDSITSGANDTSLDSTYVNQALFIQEEMSAHDVLADLMTTHNCRFYQSNEWWVVERLESLNTGASQTAKKRDKTTYAYIADEINNTPISIHTDNKPIGSANLSFIEAPKEIEVNTDLVLFDNILENDGLDNWGNRVKWTDIGGGNMTESTNGTTGYPSTNSWNNQTIGGDTVLGIGLGITNSLYNFSASGKTHDITAIVDNGANKLTLTFTNEFTGVAPNWTTASKLLIENRGTFEITIAPTVGAAGVSTVQIRVQDTGSTPKNGDRIIGDINLLFALEQTLKIPSTETVKDFTRDSNMIMELEIEYASQWWKGTVYGITPDNGVHFMGIKAENVDGDTFNGAVWDNLAINGINTTFTQIIQIPETEHEQFTDITIEIPLDWDSSLTSTEELHVALIGGYAKAVIYKSIKYKIINRQEHNHTEPNVADNNTNIILSGTLFKAQNDSVNTEYSAIGGLLDSSGNEHLNFSTGQLKNDVIAELIKDGYDDNVQMWRGTLNKFVDSNHIIKDPKNFFRTFQIQEITNNINKGVTNVTAAEIVPQGIGNLLQGESAADTLQGESGINILQGE